MKNVCVSGDVCINPEYVESYEIGANGELFVNLRSTRVHRMKGDQAKKMKDELDRAFNTRPLVERAQAPASPEGAAPAGGPPAKKE